MKILQRFEKNKDSWFLVLISFLFFLLRFPSIFEPLWYGDEGIYEVIGLALNQGRLLYQGIWDNKPPFIYLLYALFHANQPTIKFVSLLCGLISVWLLFYITKKLFQFTKVQYSTTAVFAFLLGIPLLEGNIANAENFMMPLILGAGLIILTNKHKLFLLLSGLLLGCAFLFKVVAVFDIAAFTLFLFFIEIKQIQLDAIKHMLREYIPLYIGFFFPFFCTLLFFQTQHALPQFIKSAFLSNIGYVNYGNTFIIPQGLLLIKLILLGLFCMLLWKRKHTFSNQQLFIMIWFAFSIFSALFSQRPYTHYMLVALSSFCLFLGMALEKTKSQLLLIGVFFLITLYFLSTFSFYTKGVGYYENFLALITNHEDLTTYRSFFDATTPRDYALTDFLTPNLQPHTNVFLWGNNAQLYTLLNRIPPGRYIVAYWIASSQQTRLETQQALSKEKPQFIIIMPNAGTYPYSLHGYMQRLVIDKAVIYERSI